MVSRSDEKLININEYLTNKNQDKLMLINPYSYGDTMLICGFKDAIEKYHNVKTHFIVKPEHEVLMKLYGITDYSVKSFEKNELKEIAKTQKLENGCSFICHPCLLGDDKKLLKSFLNCEMDFIDIFRKTLSLPEEAELKKPVHIPQITPELNEKLKNIAPLDKIILFSPESFATERVTPRALEYRIKELKEDGYTVISSVKEKSEILKGSVYIPLSIYDALAIGINCAGVYAVRSGFVDLMIQYIDQMTVYYPNIRTFNQYNLKYFKDKTTNDIIVEGSFVEKYSPIFQLEHKNTDKMFRFCITLLRIKKRKDKVKYSVFGIPIWKVRYFARYKKYYLFGFICVLRRNY